MFGGMPPIFRYEMLIMALVYQSAKEYFVFDITIVPIVSIAEDKSAFALYL